MDTVIETADLRRHYRGFEAVRGIDLTVARGELFALLGTNGAGKTSTLEVLEGQATPTAGTVRVLGRDPYRERAAVRPRIGVMLQEGGFPTELTVTETARMWAGCTSGARPVAEALELTRLSKRGRCGSSSSPVASADASISRWPCWDGPRCCSWTSRRPAWTRSPAARPGS
ncbi:hypothetical protein SANT12839_016510 [Streptomyces antimycoticus]|uniref:ABC transporter domain-containing protein n=1 Tax=Streptomyces antimycoticus TaxID=68175 RepID=A0A4D4K395_9ACTN|nr:hypothetical protein SANT12839_016510 [Streptomyces antimycoticus]